MLLDLDNNQIVISSEDITTYNLKYLNNYFNKKVYKNKNLLYFEEVFKNVEFVLYDNTFIKSNLYTNKLENNVKQIEEVSNIDKALNIDKLQSLEDINIIEDINRLQSLEDINILEDNLKEVESEFSFNIKTTYYLELKVVYKYNSVFYYINLKDMNLEDKLHLFNLIKSNILYHYVDIYQYKGKVKYINLHYNFDEVIKYLDRHNFRFNEFKLIMFINKNNDEFLRVFKFMKYSILQLHKLNFNYIELNKLFITLSRYVYKNKTYDLFLFLSEFKKFRRLAYHNYDYNNKLKQLVLNDERFNIELDNYDQELGYLNLCFFEKDYKERFSSSENLEEDKIDMEEKSKENTYDKGYKKNNHGFHDVLGDIYATELMYNDEFYKTVEFRNENRWTH